MEAWVIWLIVAGSMFILEILTVGFLFFWSAIAALITLALSFVIPNPTIQFVIFVISSILLILCTKPFVKKISPKDKPTNVYSVLGKKAIVSQTIENVKGLGQIKIDGDIWSAKNEIDEEIPEGTEVEILKIDGVKAVVKKI